MHPIACDPRVKRIATDFEWMDLNQLEKCHGLILCQAHSEFLEAGGKKLSQKLISNGVFIDIPGAFSNNKDLGEQIKYWSL
jgi:hypothetical protein